MLRRTREILRRRRESAGHLAGALALLVLLTACGGDDGGGAPAPSPSGTTVSGSVQAPNGQIAFNKPPGVFERLTSLFIPTVHASISGLSAVPDGTAVQLARFNATGTGVTTLATTSTRGGRYAFNLTNLGLQFSNDLMVQASGPTGTIMRAFATNTAVDVDPASELAVRLVLEQIAATPGGSFSHFTVKEVNDIAASLTLLTTAKPFTGGANLEATITTIRNAVTADPVLTAFIAAAAETGQTTLGPGDVGNYFPFTQGNVWNMQGTRTETGQPTITFQNVHTITGTKLIGPITATVFSESNNAGSGTPEDEYLTKETTGITFRGNNDPTDTITPQVIPYQEVQFPLQVGASFHPVTKNGLDFGQDLDGDGKNESANITSQVTVIGFETVAVPAGSFANTIQINIQLTTTVFPSKNGSPVTARGTITLWHAPGVGTVKRRSVTQVQGSTETETEELVSYLVNGQGAGAVPVTIATGVAQANSDTTNPGPSGIASNGTDYLVVFCKDLATPPGLFGAFSAKGVPGQPFFIAPRTCTSNNGIGVAFDGTNYLVAFSNNGTIWGVRVSPSGNILDGSGGFAISTGAPGGDWRPSVAFDGTNYLVVWDKVVGAPSGGAIYGARVTPAGQALKEFPLLVTSTASQGTPSLAFDGTNYLVVWTQSDNTSSTPHSEIYGTRVSTGGSVLDSAGIAIATAPGSRTTPKLSYDGTNYLVVWSDFNSQLPVPPPIAIFGKRIRPDGSLLDGAPSSLGIAINTATTTKRDPTLVFDGTNYLVAWAIGDFSGNPPAGIYGAKVSTGGQVVAGQPDGLGVLLNGPPQNNDTIFAYPVASSTQANTLLTWINNREVQGTTKSIQGLLIFP